MVETIGRRGVRLANRLEGLGLRVIGESLTASGASTGPLVVLGGGVQLLDLDRKITTNRPCNSKDSYIGGKDRLITAFHQWSEPGCLSPLRPRQGWSTKSSPRPDRNNESAKVRMSKVQARNYVAAWFVSENSIHMSGMRVHCSI